MGQSYLPLSLQASATLADFGAPSWLKVMSDLAIAMNDSTLLLMVGGSGMGKTRLITALSHSVSRSVCVAMDQLPIDPDTQWQEESAQWLDDWQRVDTLFLDDVHSIADSNFWQKKLVHLLNVRLQNGLRTVLAVVPEHNYTLADFASRLLQAARIELPPCLTAADKKWYIARFLRLQGLFVGHEGHIADVTELLSMHAPGDVAALFMWLQQLQTVALARQIRPSKAHIKQVVDTFVAQSLHMLQNKT